MCCCLYESQTGSQRLDLECVLWNWNNVGARRPKVINLEAIVAIILGRGKGIQKGPQGPFLLYLQSPRAF